MKQTPYIKRGKIDNKKVLQPLHLGLIYIYIYIKKKIIKIKEQKAIINVDDEEENVNDEIVLQNDK